MDMSTLVSHFVSPPREREKRDTRDSRGMKERERAESGENILPLPLPTIRIAGLAQL